MDNIGMPSKPHPLPHLFEWVTPPICVVDNDTVPTSLMSAVESEDTPLSYAHAFLAAARIPDADLSVLFDQIEDIVAQADETPSTLYVSWLCS